MRPTGRLGHLRLVKPSISGVAVGLQQTLEAGQVRPWMLALAIGAVAIQHRRWRETGERPVITNVAPQSSGLRLAQAWGQHRHGGVVGVQPVRRHHMRRDGIDQRAQQRRRLANPVRQRRAIQIDPVTGIDLGLSIQRQMVAVFRHQHMCEQTRTGKAAGNRQARRGRLGDGLTAAAGQFRSHMADHAERAGHIFQQLGDILAQRTQCPAATWASTGGGMFHHIARQGLGQLPAGGLATRLRGFRLGCFGFGWRRLRQVFLEIAQQQFQLFDLTAQLLRRGAEPLTQQAGEALLQLLVAQNLLLQPSARGGQFGRMRRLAIQQQRAQGPDRVGQRCRIERGRHPRSVFHRSASGQELSCPIQPFPVSSCAPACASRCLPATSTTAPASVTPRRPSPVAR